MFVRRAALVLSVAICVGCHSTWTVDSSKSPAVLFSSTNHRAKHHLHKGLHWYSKGELHHAKKHFQKAVAADDESGIAHNNLGLVKFDLGDYAAAAESFQVATRLMPDNPEPIYNLALAFEEVERYDEALGLYQQAHLMEPANPHYLGNAVRTRMKLGEPAMALIPELQELIAIECRPDWREWELYMLHYEALDAMPTETDDYASYDVDSIGIDADLNDGSQTDLPTMDEWPSPIPTPIPTPMPTPMVEELPLSAPVQ